MKTKNDGNRVLALVFASKLIENYILA